MATLYRASVRHFGMKTLREMKLGFLRRSVNHSQRDAALPMRQRERTTAFPVRCAKAVETEIPPGFGPRKSSRAFGSRLWLLPYRHNAVAARCRDHLAIGTEEDMPESSTPRDRKRQQFRACAPVPDFGLAIHAA